MWGKITAQGSSQLKIVWGAANGEIGSYTVNAAFVQDAAEVVRDCLNELTDAYLYDETTGGYANEGELVRILRDLAKAGSDLHFSLFHAEPGSDAPPIARIRESFERKQSSDPRLALQVSTDFSVPFGLVFAGDLTNFPSTLDGVLKARGFWGLKQQISVRSGITEELLPHEDVHVIALLNQQEFSAATVGLSHPPPEVLMAMFKRRPPGMTYELRHFEELIAKAASENAIVYFFGHANSQVLHVSKRERISALKLVRLLRGLSGRDVNPHSRSETIVFLNACDTGVSSFANDFHHAMNQDGVCGFVASEARLPAPFAVRYAHAFFSKMLEEGHTVGDAMWALIEPNWPYSLLYACYANPNYRIAVAADAEAINA